jgi:hypothetical protein
MGPCRPRRWWAFQQWRRDRSRQRRTRRGRFSQHNSNIVTKCKVLRIVQTQEMQDRVASIIIAATPPAVLGVALDYLLKSQRGHHGRIPQCLQFQVPAVLGPLKFNDHQIRIAVKAEQIDSPLRVLPFTEFLSNDVKVVIYDLEGSSAIERILISDRSFSTVHRESIDARKYWSLDSSGVRNSRNIPRFVTFSTALAFREACIRASDIRRPPPLPERSS